MPCSQCGAIAARIEIEFGDRPSAERSGFLGLTTLYPPLERVNALHDALAAEDLMQARALEPDFMAFVCPECARAYCEGCWTIGGPEFDEGFYDLTRGTCPQGHGQIVDD